MTYVVDLVDKQTLSPAGTVNIINEPTLTEEINAGYTFELEVHYMAKNSLNNNVLIEVGEQYFQIAKVIKARNDSISLTVQCEHVSYELIDEIDMTEEYEDTAHGMLASILSGTRFALGPCIVTGSQYYKPSSTEVRQRLIDIANLFGGELVFDNFTISLVQQRGSNKGLKVELGVNLLGVTEEMDYVDNTTAYELDLVDLAEVNGYELDFSKAEIGDTIQIVDNELGIDTTERILSIQSNPFKPQLPVVTVGDYIRDLTEYFKPEEKDEKEEKDTKSLFKQFKIGGIDLLEKSTDASKDVIEYLSDKYTTGVEVSTTYNTLKDQLTGIVVELQSSSQRLSIVRTTVNDVGIELATITEITSPTQLASVVLNKEESIVAVISPQPLQSYLDNPKLAEGAEIHAIGIKVTFADDARTFFETFSVGDVSVIGLENSDATEVIAQYITNPSQSPIAVAEKEVEDFLVGLNVKPAEEYKKWFVTLIHSKNDGQGNWTHTTHSMPIANFASFKVPNNVQDSVILVISNEPWENIKNGTSSPNAYYKAFGATFLLFEAPPPVYVASDFFTKLNVGDVDMLDIVSNETDGVIRYIKGQITEVIATSLYTNIEQLTGLFAQLKTEYKNRYLTLFDHSNGTMKVVDYSATAQLWKYPATLEGSRSFVIVITEEPFSNINATNVKNKFLAAFGAKVEIDTTEPITEEKLYLEFGTVNLADQMQLVLKNGPYDEIKSITTGLTSDAEITTDVTIKAKPIKNAEGKYETIDLTATNATATGKVNAHVVCMKVEVVKGG
ncbi:phage tail protein [Lysinibacillus sp. KU-BSD001]|uniref:phage tail protein n=1 Tax=Lysinibacillus sp. KU-BSD001 TaxID=3141328 RepID=UPI0036ECEEC7